MELDDKYDLIVSEIPPFFFQKMALQVEMGNPGIWDQADQSLPFEEHIEWSC